MLERIKARDPDAWQRFVRLYSPLVYGWCRLAGLQEADAADVGQEVFKAVLRAIGKFRHDRKGDSFRGWLRTITRNKIRDFAQARPTAAVAPGGSDAQARLLELPDRGPADSDSAADEDERLLLHRRAVELVLADCKEETRQAFLRVVVEGQDPRDVARDLGMTPNAVYLAKSRILRRLRDEFAGLVDA